MFAAERVHGDDTTVPVMAGARPILRAPGSMSATTGRLADAGPPCAVFYYSRDRAGIHPQTHLAGYSGIFQADAYGGYNKLYESGRTPGPILEAACWAHARRKFFELADIARNAKRKAQGHTPAFVAPMALAAVQRIDAMFEIERAINGKPAAERLAVRQELSAPLVADLEAWMRSSAPNSRAITMSPRRWTTCSTAGIASPGSLSDGRICLSNNAAERAMRGMALGRETGCSAGSDRGGQRAAMMYSLITTAKMNDIDPQAWLADVLARIADHPAHRLDELMPWNWTGRPAATVPCAA